MNSLTSSQARLINMRNYFDGTRLTELGLNLHAIFDIADLPGDLRIQGSDDYQQMIVIGHGGRTLWQSLKQHKFFSDNPVDDFSVEQVHLLFQQQYPEIDYQVIYPGDSAIGLRQLGELAGWHHDSPFRIGINETWGSWFAYRVVLLCNSAFQTNIAEAAKSPCINCSTKPCINACPASALKKGQLEFQSCIDFRLLTDSRCKNTCFSRIACPVATQHRYTEEQIQYHYGVSMRTIEEYFREKQPKP